MHNQAFACLQVSGWSQSPWAPRTHHRPWQLHFQQRGQNLAMNEGATGAGGSQGSPQTCPTVSCCSRSVYLHPL